ncbi:MAG: (4Fe-4S)-binding protein, partial [Candidatus Omnitrophica bacterium]|nr:(4Fe-4S)-binding protein [Candidatus Omnitrophota bacterium]
TSCPVITAVKGSDFCVLVTEPTPFGLNDLILAVGVLRKLRIPFGVVINRSDIGDGKVEDYCRKENIPILMEIPFSREIAARYSEGIPVVEQAPSFRDKFINLYINICGIKNEANSRY